MGLVGKNGWAKCHGETRAHRSYEERHHAKVRVVRSNPVFLSLFS